MVKIVEVKYNDESRCFPKDVQSRASDAKSIINSARRKQSSAFLL